MNNHVSEPWDLESLADHIHDTGEGSEITVRELLQMFNAKRRGYAIVHQIRAALDKLGLTTDPDFESAYIDSTVQIQLVASPADLLHPHDLSEEEMQAIVASSAKTKSAYPEVEAAYRISRLQAANSRITSVNPSSSLMEAVTLMLATDYSQLPVMQGERNVKGVITWQSIGTGLALNRSVSTVQDLMEPPYEIRAELSIFQAIPIIEEHQYVLVRAKDNRITGIVTPTDLNIQFQKLAEPFLQLAEIEAHVRKIIDQRFALEVIAEARNPSDIDRQVKNASDLSFGEYVRLLEKPEQWLKTGLLIDRFVFCRELEKVRIIRNDVMHFDPDGIPTEDLDQLRKFARLLQRLQSVGIT